MNSPTLIQRLEDTAREQNGWPPSMRGLLREAIAAFIALEAENARLADEREWLQFLVNSQRLPLNIDPIISNFDRLNILKAFSEAIGQLANQDQDQDESNHKYQEVLGALAAMTTAAQKLARAVEVSIRPIRQIVDLANVNEPTRAMLVHIGTQLNQALKEFYEVGPPKG